MEQLLNFASSEHEAMDLALNRIVIEATNELQKAEQSCLVIQKSLQNLKDFLLAHTFNNKQDEIHFFKEIKPRFFKELIYFTELYYLESSKPVASPDALERYYTQEMDRVSIFFERNHDLHVYYLTGKTMFDELYFVRGAEPIAIIPEYSPDIDPRFSTVAGFKVSKIQALEKLHRYLQHQLNRLAGVPSEFKEVEKPKRRKLIWTDPKIGLIEVVYAVYAKGAVNNGQVSIKDLFEGIEELFNIDLGNYYGALQQNIRIRKKDRTPYLQGLVLDFVNMMDHQDVNPRVFK